MTPGGGALAHADRELLEFVAEGWSPGTIAGVLGVPRDEVMPRVRSLMQQLGLAAPSPMFAARLALLALPPLTGPFGD
jgi:hypothetical protein